jgi:hypothetical protein
LNNEEEVVEVRWEREEDRELWISPRRAAEILRVSVAWIYQLANRTPPAFRSRFVRTGKVRVELRLFLPDVQSYREPKEDWGRQRLEPLTPLTEGAIR